MGLKLLCRVRSDIISEIIEVRPLTSKEYENYKGAVSTLRRINDNLDLFKVVYYNFRDYELTLNHSFRQFAENPAIDMNRMEGMVLELNRRISNYLSSVRLFLDHSEYTLKKRHGKNSLIVDEFKNTCSNAYDSNFSYRFLYKLRNYVQHCGMPIGFIKLKSEAVDNEPNKVRHHFELKFNRDLLLEKFDWKKLEPEIKKLPSKFDINPHIHAMNESIGDITFALIKNELPDGIRCSEYLKTLILEAMDYGKSQGTPCVLDTDNITDNEGNLNLSNIQWFPLHLIQWVEYFNPNRFIKLDISYDSDVNKPVYDLSNLDNPNNPLDLTKPITVTIDKDDRISNLDKGINGMLYNIPEKYQICPKCGGPLGFYYKNEVGITGENYTAECFGCLKCKGII